MVMDTVVERFVEQTPIIVMARMTLQRALKSAWIDTLFELCLSGLLTKPLQVVCGCHGNPPTPVAA